MSAGAADGWSFLGFGNVFVANMTGNTVLMGISIFSYAGGGLHAAVTRSGHVLHPALALAAYAVGVAIASYVTGKAGPGAEKSLWTRNVTRVLMLETLLAAVVEWAWYADRRGAAVPMAALMAVMAMCMGLQSGAMLQLRIPGVVTTYITGTWTVMVQGLTRLVAGEGLDCREPKAEYEERLAIQAGTLAVYLLSAVLTGWLYEEAPAIVGVIPVVCLATVSAWSWLRGGVRPVAD